MVGERVHAAEVGPQVTSGRGLQVVGVDAGHDGAVPVPRVALAPTGVRSWLTDAIRAGGGEVVDPQQAEVLVWAEPAQADRLGALLRGDAAGVTWVQLPWAGIEPYVAVVRAEAERIWTCGKGVYAEPVAEHALALLLGGLRGLDRYVPATTWTAPHGTNLLGAKVVVLGGGGITTSLLRLLEPFGCDVTVVRRTPEPMVGASSVVGVERLDDALTDAVGVVLALALTPETEGIIAARQLERISDRGWLVNVARGRHVVTGDLVAALHAGTIGGAALDVTEPEPLPEGHPLWSAPRCIITPHVGNTPEMAEPLLAARITDNVRRWARGEPLVGVVDPALGY
jgi:phosphoglycerate dehydrogenase-like enzyme